MKTGSSIAVAIPTRNRSNLLGDALDSVFRQTVSVVDVVVCDDAGTDDCGAVVEAYRRKLPAEKAGVPRYMRNEACLGIGGNFDRGVREAAGEYVIKLDSDDTLEPRFAEVLGGALEGCTGEDVMVGFRATAARLCRASGMDEGDGATRRLFFATAARYGPTAGNRVAAGVLGPLPREVTVRMAALGKLPRVLGRLVLKG